MSEKFSAPEKIAHIGIAVHNIDNALPFYTEHLGLTLKGVEEVESEQVKVAFLQIGESSIELLEPLSESSAVHQFLQKKGEGIHHIALEVDSIEKRLEKLKNDGVRLINEQPKDGANNSKIAFVHPKSSFGVLYELCEHEGSED